jgi:2-hydroxy-3-oxopropionate reductase
VSDADPSEEAHRPGTLRVGVLGLGIMGGAMARRVSAAGVPLVISDRSRGPVAELAAAGASVVGAPAEVARRVDVLVVNVPDTPDLLALVDGPEGIEAGAHPGLVVVAMGTHAPAAMPPIAERLGSVGAAFLDAPVSGGDIGAREGTLSIMVGGDAEALERATPVLRLLGTRITHIGPSGAGQVAKACNQLVVGSTIQAVAEAWALAQACGVDGVRVLEALKGGLAGSVVLERYARRMAERDFEPGGRVRLHAKDARIVMAAADGAGLRLPGFEPVAAAFEELVRTGRGDLDHSSLVLLVEPEA